jgi:hypothetical protein
MLNQQMTSPNLATAIHARLHLRSAVVLSHVLLELLGVCSLWGLPSRQLLRLVEVIRQVL